MTESKVVCRVLSQMHRISKSKNLSSVPCSPGFTLIELLIVIGVVAILAVIVVIIINPVEILRGSRDSNRFSDLQLINKGLLLATTELPNSAFGSSSIVYVSLPDNAATTTEGTNCLTLGLPSLSAGWSYHCASSSTYRRIDGTGWIPINFANLSFESPFGALPKDPINSTSSGNYYIYVTGGSWEINTLMESGKYRYSGDKDKVSSDGGDSFAYYEVGTNLNLSPINDSGLIGHWSFDEGSGTSVSDSSGRGNDGTINGSVWTSGKLKGALSFDGVDDNVQGTKTGFPSGPISAISYVSWVKVAASGGVFGTGNGKSSFQIVAQTYNQLFMHGCDGSDSTITIGSNNPNDGKWHYAGMSYLSSGNKLVGMLDGMVVTSVSNGQPSMEGSDLYIGKATCGPAYFGGVIDELRVYNRAISPAEMVATYNATK